VQYVFLWAWGHQTQEPPWAAHTLATPLKVGLLHKAAVWTIHWSSYAYHEQYTDHRMRITDHRMRITVHQEC